MRVLLRSLCVFILIVALAALALRRDELAAVGLFVPELATIVIAALIGFVLAFRPAPSNTSLEPVLPLAVAAPPGTTSPVDDSSEQRALLTFARQLVDGTARGDVPGAVEAHLPAMVNGRKVWIAMEPRHQSPPGNDRPRIHQAGVLNDDVQEWTTFALRLDEQRIGLLGVESPGGLALHLRQRIQALVPLISQALKSAHEVDTFREASVVDLLTGAATRREGLNRLQAEVKRAQRTGSAMAVLMIDLDHFKSINDRFGHAVGDELLTAIGETMQRTLRATDVRCRWGGEEFLIVLPDTSLAQAQVVATHLLHNLAATAIPSARGPVSSTASIGLTISRPAETDVNRIVARADMALYQAKHAGRSCIRVVLGGYDGEPVGLEGPRKVPAPATETLPFPDRRAQDRGDRRKVPSPGRRRTDRAQASEAPTTAERSRVRPSEPSIAARG
jgi:diguanylate cyclase (GGDEF)-like protein